MTKWILGVLAALLIIGSADVGAASAAYSSPEGWGALDLQIAKEYWGVAHSPNCATETVDIDDGVAEGGAGLATLATEPGTECTMHLLPGLGVIQGCLTVVHEFGHWLGLAHSADPQSVMYPSPTDSNVPIRCFRAYLLMHPDRNLHWAIERWKATGILGSVDV